MKQTQNRLSSGERQKQAKRLRFYFNNKPYYGTCGDTVQSALLANGITGTYVTRTHARHIGANSALLHRGYISVRHEGSDAMIFAADDVMLCENMVVSYVHKPSLFENFKSLSLKRFFAQKGYVAEKLSYYDRVSLTAFNLGLQSVQSDAFAQKSLVPKSFEAKYVHTDIHISGGTVAGLYAALISVMSGLRVLITDKKLTLEPEKTGDISYDRMARAIYDTISDHPLVTIMTGCRTLPFSKDKDVTVLKAPEKYDLESSEHFHSEILHIKAKKTFIDNELKEYGFLFSGSDLGGVFTGQYFAMLNKVYGISYSKNMVLYTNNDTLYRLIDAFDLTPAQIGAIIDVRPDLSAAAQTYKERGFQIFHSAHIQAVHGKERPETVTFLQNNILRTIESCVVITSSGFDIDIELFAACEGALKAEFSENEEGDKSAFISIDQKALGDNLRLIGFAARPDTYKDMMCGTYETVKSILEDMGYNISFPDTLSAQLDDDMPLSYVTFQKGQKHFNKDKIFFPTDIKLSDFKELFLKEGEALSHFAPYIDTHLLSKDQVSLYHIICVLAEEYEYTALKQCELFASYFAALYQESLQKKCDDFCKSAPILAHTYPSSHMLYKQHNIPLLTDQRDIIARTNDIEADTDLKQSLYETIKENYGVRHHAYLAGPYQFSGPDAVIQLEEAFKVSLADLPLLKGRQCCISDEENDIYGSVDILHLRKNTYYVFSYDIERGCFERYLDILFGANSDKKFVFKNQFEQYDLVHILGTHADKACAFLNVNFSDIDTQAHSNLHDYDVYMQWLANIDIVALRRHSFQMGEILCFVPSDTLCALLPCFFPDNKIEQKMLFESPLIEALNIEFDRAVVNRYAKEFPYKGIIASVHQQDVLQEGAHIFETEDQKKATGLVLKNFYSPIHKRYMALSVFNVANDQLSDKMLSISYQNKNICKAKLMSPDYLLSREPEIEGVEGAKG
ncbi:MAG: hypothetical protein AAF621_02455 [Pseudomonadota bacterium]